MDRRRLFLAIVLGTTACSHDVAHGIAATTGTAESSSTAAATGSSGADGSSSTALPAGESSSEAADSEGSVKLDVGAATGPDLGGVGDGCDKIDFLFVVDNSGSMAEEQQSLIASFPGFIATIADTVTATDFHVMVVDTDEESLSFGNGFACDGAGNCNCNPSPQCCYALCDGDGPIVFNPPPATCGGLACGAYVPPSGCDVVLGAGKTTDLLYQDCGIVDGARWMTETQPDLGGTFECVALVGAGGDGNERPMAAMNAAVTAENQLGACNEGFLRDDAILVVTVITDEDDLGSPGTAFDWRQALVDAKLGNEEAIAVLGLLGDTALPGAVCIGEEADDAPLLRTFAESFTHGQWASVCEPDYAGFFADAVALIDTTCDEFHPEG